SDLGQLPKRLVLGRPVRSDRAGESLLPKRLALPIFASDALSSVAYATQEIMIILTLGGVAYLYLTPWLAAGVVVLLVTVVLSSRQVVHAYPSGGGDYEVAMKNHGQFAALVVASALLTDYVLTVAVSVSSGTDNIISAFPSLNAHRVVIALTLVVLLAAANLRGLRESGKAFAVPTALALFSHVHYTQNACDLQGFPDCATEPQRTVISQVAAAVFGGETSIGFFYIQAATALVLILAANTAFNGFPLLGSVLAQDRFLPRQLHTRGDKLVYSNGILLLAGFAA